MCNPSHFFPGPPIHINKCKMLDYIIPSAYILEAYVILFLFSNQRKAFILKYIQIET